jgi:hypothetical protein
MSIEVAARRHDVWLRRLRELDIHAIDQTPQADRSH